MKVPSSFLTVAILFIVMSLGLLCFAKFSASLAQDVSQEKKTWKVMKGGPKRMGVKAREPAELESESVIEDQIPPGVPIAVEIVNLKMDSLLREIEVKVTNISRKPIYYLGLAIVLPEDLSEAGYPLGFPLIYGRQDLIKFETPVEPTDQPLLPKESAVLKIDDKYLIPFEHRKAKQTDPHEVKRAYLMFRRLNFGDKTGLSGDGSPVPDIGRLLTRGSH